MPDVPGFLPSRWGFQYSNRWPSVPLRTIDFGLIEVPIGDASNGLCGGMVFACRDFFEAGMIPPPNRPGQNDPMFTYLVDRLFDSFNLPAGPQRYYFLMNPSLPDDESQWSQWGLVPHGRAWVMIREEWPKIKRDLDSGQLCPLGLIQVKSTDPLDMGKNHQVLAYGYELNGSDLRIKIYDPNYPHADDVTLSLNIGDPYNRTDVIYSPYSPPRDVYCFFRPDYTYHEPHWLVLAPGAWMVPLQVPGWFGAHNQGAGVAVADINLNGRPDLVIFHIDNPSGENVGYYRIGWNLDANGNVTGGWGQPKRVPGWFGSESQGAGVAVAYVRGSWQPDLAVFHIDNPSGENSGYYRIGSDLDDNGNPTGGWGTDIYQVLPAWFGAHNEGGAIALADLNSTGTPDLIVFHIDNPEGENAGYYRVGWNP